jgi:hypothetical protein
MIVALAGRRIDPTDADAEDARFPEANVGLVRSRLRRLLREVRATTLVSSGASGADLLAMDVAGGLGLRRRMILPFEPARFRAASVTDRPGDWGALFDSIVAELGAAGDLVVHAHAGEPDAAYVAVNVAILDEAERLAALQAPPGEDSDPRPGALAVVVWNGRSRGPDDLTAAFVGEAHTRGHAVTEVSTLGEASPS